MTCICKTLTHCRSYIRSKVRVQHLRRVFDSCMKRWSLLLQRRIQSSLLQARSLKTMQHSSSMSSSKMLLHLILRADHARKWNTRLIIWCVSTTYSNKRLAIMMKKWKKRKSDVHCWIIKYNYKKMIVMCINDISTDKCLWENAWSSLFYWLWNQVKFYIIIISKKAWVIEESCNSETDSDNQWSSNSLLWYTLNCYWVDWSWESLQELKHWVSCCEHMRIWYDSWLLVIK